MKLKLGSSSLLSDLVYGVYYYSPLSWTTERSYTHPPSGAEVFDTPWSASCLCPLLFHTKPDLLSSFENSLRSLSIPYYSVFSISLGFYIGSLAHWTFKICFWLKGRWDSVLIQCILCWLNQWSGYHDEFSIVGGVSFEGGVRIEGGARGGAWFKFLSVATECGVSSYSVNKKGWRKMLC